MPSCITCGSHFRSSPYNNSNQCDTCVDIETYDADGAAFEANLLMNPSGKVQPVFYDDADDSHGY